MGILISGRNGGAKAGENKTGECKMNGKSFFISVFILCCVIILGGNAFGDNGKKGKDGKHEYKGKS